MTKLNVAQALLPARGAKRRIVAEHSDARPPGHQHGDAAHRNVPLQGRLRRRADKSVCATLVGGASSNLRTVAIAAITLLLSPLTFAATLRVNGSTTVNPVATEAAEILRAEKKLAITVDTQGGSSAGISGVADHSIEVGMSSKAITEEDRKKFPKVNFVSTSIGQDAVALVVSKDVWEGGVKALTRQQAKDIYEGRITNWKQVGGPDRRIVFFNKEPGRGTWEVFAHWLYANPKNAPAVRHREVGGNEEGRTKVASTKGAITQLSFAWAEGDARIHALGAKLDDGRVVMPSSQTIADHSYPMARPLLLVTDGPPKGEAKLFIDFVRSSRGQSLVRKHGYLPLSTSSGAAAAK